MMWFIIATTLAFILGALGYYLFRAIREKRNLELKRTESQILIEAAKKEAGKIRVEGELQAKEIIERSKSEADRDYREKQKELSKIEKRLQSREENIDKKYESIERKETEISRREREALSKEKIVAEKEKELNSIITEAKKKIEDELHEKAESKSKDIIALAIQKYAGQYTSEKTISVVNLPNDEMKGRIIGREGRNIRSIEARTGVDIIIDDTPETVVISSLNPIRREVARIALERLIADGRIHPARIEEVVTEVEDDIEKEIQKAGEEAVFDIGAHNMHPELVKLVGKLKYRTSFSQNILNHSLEVAFICGVIAGELGLNVKIARRVGLLHDIGKAL